MSKPYHSPPQHCPICKNSVNPVPRYPSYVCRTCLDQSPPVTATGKQIRYGNIDFAGGIQSLVEGSGDWLQQNDCEAICYVKGRKCRAQEARFGGIVIQTIDERQTQLNNSTRQSARKSLCCELKSKPLSWPSATPAAGVGPPRDRRAGHHRDSSLAARDAGAGLILSRDNVAWGPEETAGPWHAHTTTYKPPPHGTRET